MSCLGTSRCVGAQVDVAHLLRGKPNETVETGVIVSLQLHYEYSNDGHSFGFPRTGGGGILSTLWPIVREGLVGYVVVLA